MTARTLIIGAIICAGGCGSALAPAAPPAQLGPPAEARRVVHPAGYSIVFPSELAASIDPPAFQGDSFTRDALASVRSK